MFSAIPSLFWNRPNRLILGRHPPQDQDAPPFPDAFEAARNRGMDVPKLLCAWGRALQTCLGAGVAGYEVISSASAMPCPPPMHRVTRPRLRPSWRIEWTRRVVRTAPVA